MRFSCRRGEFAAGRSIRIAHTIERKGVGAMQNGRQEEIVVSGGGKLRAYDAQKQTLTKETMLEGSGALCADGVHIYCASDVENVIYRLQGETLLPQSVYAGGPGMRALCLSRDGESLFVLLADADSVLMLRAQDGMPMCLARVGVYPQRMKLDESGEALVVAGGKDGCAYLLCARTLRLLARQRGRGFCAEASRRAGRVCALRMEEERFAAAGKLIGAGDTAWMFEPLHERLYAYDAAQKRWRLVCTQARDAARLTRKDYAVQTRGNAL